MTTYFLTLVLTVRNRDLAIVKKSLQSLNDQSHKDFKIVLVNYGSTKQYTADLQRLVIQYPCIELIDCPVSQQLWNKCRSINMVLNTCDTPYLFVADIDMMFRPDFILKIDQLKKESEVIYFNVGFLSETESKKERPFHAYKINHVSTSEATGMTLYPVRLLKSINGYDEFYHGWGSEDTDTHVRLRNAGIQVRFYKEEMLMLHQWHPKSYRTIKSLDPFHSQLELINSKYLTQTQSLKIVKANKGFEIGLKPSNSEYAKLINPEIQYVLTTEQSDIDAFFSATIFNLKEKVVQIQIRHHHLYKQVKNKVKPFLGKKNIKFYSLQAINDKVLMTIITHFRNTPYEYQYDIEKQQIVLKIILY